MKKGKKIVIITALSSLLLGIILMVSGIAVVGFDIGKLFKNGREVYLTETLPSDFDRIDIETAVDSVEFYPSEDSGCYAQWAVGDKYSYDYTVENRTLIIRFTDHQAWYEKLHLTNPQFSTVKLYLPRTAYERVKVRVGIGSVTIPDSFTIDEIDVSTGIGSVNLPKSKNVSIDTGIGDITLPKPSQNDDRMKIDVGIGNIKVN